MENVEKQAAAAPQEGVPLPRPLEDGDLAFLVRYAKHRKGGNKEGDAGQEEEDAQELERLRQHVTNLWQTCLADATVLYGCVRELLFLYPRVDTHSHYPQVKATATSSASSSARFLDLGCCFGTDTRQLIVDGLREEDVVAVDVISDFWNFGLKLYEDADSLKAKFHSGDITSDPAFVQSLVADGRFAHVWTGAVLHVLTEAKVEAFLRSVFDMLQPGGSLFGDCMGSSEQPGEWVPPAGLRNRSPAYHHTLQSLEALMQRIGFEETVVHERDLTTLVSPSVLERLSGLNTAGRIVLGFSGKKPVAQ